jgi:hypothetical protein
MSFLDSLGKGIASLGDVLEENYGFVKDVAMQTWDDPSLGGFVHALINDTTAHGAKILGDVMGPQGAIGAPIGGMPDWMRTPGRYTVRPIQDADQWVYSNGISHPLSTLLEVGSLTESKLWTQQHGYSPGDLGILFDPQAWQDAYSMTEHKSPGAALADNLNFALFPMFNGDRGKVDIMNNAQLNKFEGSDFFKATSGLTDGLIHWYDDPLNIVGSYAGAARIASKFPLTEGMAEGAARTQELIDQGMDPAQAARYGDVLKASLRQQQIGRYLASNLWDKLSGRLDEGEALYPTDLNQRAAYYKNQVFKNPITWDAATALAQADGPAGRQSIIATMMGDNTAAREIADAAVAERLRGKTEQLSMIADPTMLPEWHESPNYRPDVNPAADAEATKSYLDANERLQRITGEQQYAPQAQGRFGAIKTIPQTSEFFQSSPFTRPVRVFFNKAPTGIINTLDPTWIDQVGYNLRQSGMSIEDQNQWLGKLAAAPVDQRMDLVQQAEQAGLKVVADRWGLHPDDLQNISTGAEEYRKATQEAIANGVPVGDTQLRIDLPGMPGEEITQVNIPKPTSPGNIYPFTDYRALDRSLSKTSQFMDSAGRIPQDIMNRSMRMWRAGVLLRPAWPIRIMGEHGLAMAAKMQDLSLGSEELMKAAKDYAPWKAGLTNYFAHASEQLPLYWGGGTGALFGGIVAGPLGAAAGGALGVAGQIIGRSLEEVPYAQFVVNSYDANGAFGNPLDHDTVHEHLVSSRKDLEAAFGMNPNQAYRAASGVDAGPPLKNKLPYGFEYDVRKLPQTEGLPLPEGEEPVGMWHATTNMEKVQEQGLRAPDKLNAPAGLGGPGDGHGNPPDEVSVTMDRAHAQYIADNLKLASEAARGLPHTDVLQRMDQLMGGAITRVTPAKIADWLHSDNGYQFVQDNTPAFDKAGEYVDHIPPAAFIEAPQHTVRTIADLAKYFEDEGLTANQMQMVLDNVLGGEKKPWAPSILPGDVPWAGLQRTADQYAALDPTNVGVVRVAARGEPNWGEIERHELRYAAKNLKTIDEDIRALRPEPNDLTHTTIMPGHPQHLSEMTRLMNEYIPENPLAQVILRHNLQSHFPYPEMPWYHEMIPGTYVPAGMKLEDFLNDYTPAEAGEMWLKNSPEGRAYAKAHPIHAQDPYEWAGSMDDLINKLTMQNPQLIYKLSNNVPVSVNDIMARLDTSSLNGIMAKLEDLGKVQRGPMLDVYDRMVQEAMDRQQPLENLGLTPSGEQRVIFQREKYQADVAAERQRIAAGERDWIPTEKFMPHLAYEDLPDAFPLKPTPPSDIRGLEPNTIDDIVHENPATLQRIPTDKIVTAQESVRLQRLKETLAGDTREVPRVIKVGDQYYLVDGNHRATVAVINGDKHIYANVHDTGDFLDERDVAMFKQALDQHGKYDPEDFSAFRPDVNRVQDQLPTLHGEYVRQVTGNSPIQARAQGIIEQAYRAWGQLPLDDLINNQLFARAYRIEVERRLAGIHPDILTDGYVQNIENAARDHALGVTRDLMYDFANRSEFANMVRTAMPFFPAWQQTLQRWAGLALENPAFINKARLILQAPGKMGLTWKDPDTGEEYVRLRLPSIAQGLLNHGLLKGALDDQGYIRFQTKGLSIAGEGLPGFGPWVDVALTPFVKDNPSLQDSLKFVFPYGVPENALQPFLPPNVQRGMAAVNNDSRSYRNAYNQILVTRLVKMHTGELPKLDLNNADTRSKFLTDVGTEAKQFAMFRMVAGAFAPAALQYDSPYQPLLDKFRAMEKADPQGAQDKFLDQFGDDFFALTQAFTKLNNGIPATPEGAQDYAHFKNLVDRFPDLGSLIIGTQAGGSPSQYSAAVYQMQRNTPLRPGSDTMQRSPLSPEDIIGQSDARLGWTKFTRSMDLLDAQLAAIGAPNYNVKQAQDLRLMKDILIAGIAKQHPQWYQEYSQRDEVKWNNQIAAMKVLVQDPRLSQRPDMEMLDRYLKQRDLIVALLGGRPSHGLDSESNSDLRTVWDTMVTKMKNGPNGLAFSDLYNRWLDTDPLNQPGPTTIGEAAA